MKSEKFESWAIIELFGHNRIAGKVSEATIGGCAFLRCDVPEFNGHEAFTKFYGNGAIYSMTPCSEEAALLALKHIMPEPVSVWMPELKQIPGADAGACEKCPDCHWPIDKCVCDD